MCLGKEMFVEKQPSGEELATSSPPKRPTSGPKKRRVPLRGSMRVLLGGLLIFLLIGVFVGTTLIRNTLQSSSASVKWSFSRNQSDLDFSPIVVGGVMYVGFDDGWLYALNAISGTIKWSVQMEGQSKEFLAPPTVVNDIVYISTKDGMLYALNAVSGATRWSVKIVTFLVSPLVVNGLVYAGFQDGTFSVLDAHSGNTRWSTSPRGDYYQPLMINGIFYLSSSFLSRFHGICHSTSGMMQAQVQRSFYVITASTRSNIQALPRMRGQTDCSRRPHDQ